MNPVTHPVRKLLSWWNEKESIPFLAVFILLIFVIRLCIVPVLYLIPELGALDILKPNGIQAQMETFISVCLMVPILETLITQHFVIHLMNYITKRRFLQVFVSALIFGLTHWSTGAYMVFAFFVGLVLATGFIILKEKKGLKHAFWITVWAHSIANFISLFVVVLDL